MKTIDTKPKTTAPTGNGNRTGTSGQRVECMVPQCPKKAVCRGNCRCHYDILKTMVHRGETTWAALEVAGLAKPRTPNGGKIRYAGFHKRVAEKLSKTKEQKR